MNINHQNKAVVYCRVSTKEQAEEGNSLVTQERNCREYAEKHGYEIIKVFMEEGESAKTAERTQLQKLLQFCSNRKEKINAVIIYKIDRLSRNTDDYSQLRILLKQYGVEIKSTSEYFENTPAGKFMENMIANVAQFDNDVRTERSIGGMKGATKEGRYVWMAPVGYINAKVNGKSSIVPGDQAWIVRRAFEFMAEKQFSIDEIYRTIISLGLTSRKGKPISKSYFYLMLRNELYTGWIYKFGERHKGVFEPIVPEELFARVQSVIRNKKAPLLYKSDHPDFPLRRFIYHPSNRKLTGSWSKGRNKKYAYYRFLGVKGQWSKETLERQFSQFTDQFAFNKDLLTKLKSEMWERFCRHSENKGQYIDSLKQSKQVLKLKQEALLQKNINGVISDTLLREQLAKLDEEIWSLDQILIKKENKQIDLKPILEFLIEFLLSPSAILQKMPLKIRLKLQWFQFPEGVSYDGNKFRTTKISSVFKLKQSFLSQMSCNVHHPGLIFEQPNSAKNPPLQSITTVVWEEVEKELKFLGTVLKDKNVDSHQTPSWKASFLFPPSPN